MPLRSPVSLFSSNKINLFAGQSSTAKDSLSDFYCRRTVSLGLFLGVTPGAGGMFQYAQSLTEAISKINSHNHNHKVVIAYGDRKWEPILNRLRVSGVHLRHVKLGLFIASMAMALRIPVRICRALSFFFNPLVIEMIRLRCDVWIFPAQEALTYQMPLPTIGSIHDLMHRYEPEFPEVNSWFRFYVREQRFKSISHVCSAIFVDSEVGRQHVVQSYGVSASKVFSIPYVFPSYLSASEERVDFEEHYKLPSQFVFYPAQFWPHKNHKRLLDAIKLVAINCSDIALVLSGSHKYLYQDIRNYAEALGISERVFFMGYVPDVDMKGFYRRARALVMPTFFGPTNIPPLEAMSIGCPVLVSGIYGMFEQCGDAAIYFSPTSVDEMAEKIESVWSNDALAASLTRKGRERSLGWTQADFDARVMSVLSEVLAINEG